MEPTLWGPGLWHIMLIVSWHCSLRNLEKMKNVVMVLIPYLLPCELCKEHFVKNLEKVKRKHKLRFLTNMDVFQWVYLMKNEVNESNKCRSISLDDLRIKFTIQNTPNEILIAHTLLLVALRASENDNEDHFVQLCKMLSVLLPLPNDSALYAILKDFQKPIVYYAYKALKNTHIEHGYPCPSLKNIQSAVH